MDAHDKIPAQPHVEKEHHDPWASEVQCQTRPPANGQRPLSAVEREMPPEMVAHAALDLDQSSLRAFFGPLSAVDRQKGLSDVINASVQNYAFEPGASGQGLVQMNWNQADDALTVNRITPHERTFGVLSTERAPADTESTVVKIPFGLANAEK